MYDETCRQEWAERTFRGDADFVLADASTKMSEELLNRAVEKYRVEYGKSTKPAAEEEGSSSSRRADAGHAVSRKHTAPFHNQGSQGGAWKKQKSWSNQYHKKW